MLSSKGSDDESRRTSILGPRACVACRQGKIKCDMNKPNCGSCTNHGRPCSYTNEPPKARPSRAIINSLTEEKKNLEELVRRLKNASSQEREVILNKTNPGSTIPKSTPSDARGLESNTFRKRRHPSSDEESWDGTDTILTASEFLSFDEAGQISALGPTSSLHNPIGTKPSLAEQTSIDNARNHLFANAAYQRQLEHSLNSLPGIDGVPINLATHLFDLYFNRGHHAFLAIYRPAFTRDILHGGPYATKFLINAVFAAASKYSDRPEVRDDIADPRTSGARFFRRCEALLTANSTLPSSDIPTAAGLALLASAVLTRGSVTKSWLYGGMAIRMIYDLGLHIDTHDPRVGMEEIEIRRRLFWSAFVYDKVQSLYLGRPFMIHPEDANVPDSLLDMMEERDLYMPYVDPTDPKAPNPKAHATPYHSVSNFQALCRLCKIMARIIQQLYLAGVSTRSSARLTHNDRLLSTWYYRLPDYLSFKPWLFENLKPVAPNIMVMNTTFHSVVILLHRPFLSHDQLSEDQRVKSYQKCSAAARAITSILRCYRSNYTLRGAPYLASYAVYVACTIHIRNAGLGDSEFIPRTSDASDAWESRKMLEELLEMLDELAISSPFITWPTNKIRRILKAPPMNDPPCKYCFTG
jgi:Fungal specific transcription factor domain/Fungal Zn(2)-Cys(6) binuclear cluster domain